MPTNDFDVKVYSITEEYVHAESRKAPTLDGVVQRTELGKELRNPLNLTREEKKIA